MKHGGLRHWVQKCGPLAKPKRHFTASGASSFGIVTCTKVYEKPHVMNYSKTCGKIAIFDFGRNVRRSGDMPQSKLLFDAFRHERVDVRVK